MARFILLFILAGGFFLSASAQTTTNGPLIAWESSTHDFGDIQQGDKVEHAFRLTNTGTQPLVITNVEVTCGCTTPKGWPRDPVAPGDKAEILISFNSLGKYGRQNKVITIISNAANPEAGQITFSTNVLEKKSPN
jgi:Protein of unknown function (DUF1573)